MLPISVLLPQERGQQGLREAGRELGSGFTMSPPSGVTKDLLLLAAHFAAFYFHVYY